MTANAGNIKLVSQLYNFESVVNKQKYVFVFWIDDARQAFTRYRLYCILHGWNVAAKDCEI